MLRMIPAQQCLKTNHAPTGELHHRLKVGLHLPGFDCNAQVSLYALLALPLVLQTLLEK